MTLFSSEQGWTVYLKLVKKVDLRLGVFATGKSPTTHLCWTCTGAPTERKPAACRWGSPPRTSAPHTQHRGLRWAKTVSLLTEQRSSRGKCEWKDLEERNITKWFIYTYTWIFTFYPCHLSNWQTVNKKSLDVMLWFIIRNMYLVFAHFWHRAPKTLRISQVIES